MKKIALLTLLLTSILCAGMVFANGQQESDPEAVAEKAETASAVEEQPAWLVENCSDHITIIDYSGREVTIKKPVERIVYNHHTPVEAVKILDAWDMVVGGWTALPSPELFPGCHDLPSFTNEQNPFDVNYEQVFELQPDLFLTIQSPMPGFKDIVEKLSPDIPVVALLDTSDPDSLMEGLKMLGAILDRQPEAEEFISWAHQLESSISEKTKELPDDKKPRVFMKTPGWSAEQLSTFTDEMCFPNRMFKAAGGVNVAGTLPAPGGWVENVDPEWLLTNDYDYIVVQVWPAIASNSLGYRVNDTQAAESVRNQIMEMDVFANSNAIKNDRVYLYHCDLATTYRYIVGMAYWAKWFQPELFSDLDPGEIHQQYLTRFMHMDYDLNKQGVIVYP